MTKSEVDIPWRAKCKINWKLVPLKLLMLLVYGAMAALYPFLTLHMRAIGLSWTEIAIISAIVPFVSCLGPPLGGALADRIGNYKITFIGFNVFSISVHLLMLLAVPSLTIERRIIHLDGSLSCASENELFSLTSKTNSKDNCSLTENPIIQWQNNPTKQMKFVKCEVKSGNESFEAPVDFHVCINHQGRNSSTCYALSNVIERRFVDLQFEEKNVSNKRTLMRFANPGSNFTFSSSYCSSLSAASELHRLSVECEIETDFQSICVKADASTTRWKTVLLYATFRFLAGIGVSTVVPILDAAAYKMSADHGGDLGVQRIFSLVGMAVFPPVSSFFVGLASKRRDFSDYSPAFYIFVVMNALAALIAFFTRFKLLEAQQNIWHNVGRILRNPNVYIFVLMMFFAGCAWGFLENYLFLFMDGLGSPKWLFGMSNLVSSVAAIPVVAISTFIMRICGHTKILMICLALYGVRFFFYSIIYNPFMVLPVELLEAFTTSLLWVVASVYCGKVAPDYLATLQGVIGCVHHALGRGIGTLLGGLMFGSLKPRLTYQIFAGLSLSAGILYMIMHYLWLRKLPKPKANYHSAARLSISTLMPLNQAAVL
ncbi:hypothetical protein BV898_18237 [Hypsibius exemplaris]|uniref:Major facilitator superfamily associated domain-containing protein n=1 Tax=Hypsibius exemplaris TaxID=2072580 RepID=A0A9X6NH88_HYPEX|nr:hypothetical protein BV898_18237 [Hypsibius exemplaris]